MGQYFGATGGYGFGFGGIFMILFWGLVIWAIIAVVRSASGQSCCKMGSHGHGHAHGSDAQSGGALDILKERYAKGEINKEDFDRMKKDIE